MGGPDFGLKEFDSANILEKAGLILEDTSSEDLEI